MNPSESKFPTLKALMMSGVMKDEHGNCLVKASFIERMIDILDKNRKDSALMEKTAAALARRFINHESIKASDLCKVSELAGDIHGNTLALVLLTHTISPVTKPADSLPYCCAPAHVPEEGGAALLQPLAPMKWPSACEGLFVKVEVAPPPPVESPPPSNPQPEEDLYA